jgi:hypothetical protein
MTKPKLETLAARAGLGVDLGVAPPLVPAIHQATVYAYPSLEALEEVFQHEAIITTATAMSTARR